MLEVCTCDKRIQVAKVRFSHDIHKLLWQKQGYTVQIISFFLLYIKDCAIFSRFEISIIPSKIYKVNTSTLLT